jgi:hypothetical protein
MASAFVSIASRALPVFRSIWGFARASPFLNSLKTAVVGALVQKGADMI